MIEFRYKTFNRKIVFKVSAYDRSTLIKDFESFLDSCNILDIETISASPGMDNIILTNVDDTVK